MNSISANEIKKIEVDIAVQFARYCEEHSLTYMLCGGTLLGAIRHKGFIPWDDDIDLMMPRPDYDRIIHLMKKESISKTIDVLEYRLDNSILPFMKLSDNRTFIVEENSCAKMGVWVDIFPIDGNFSNNILNFLHYESAKILRKLVECQIFNLGVEKKKITRCIRIIIAPLLRLFSHKFLCTCLDRVARIKDFNSSDLVGRVLMGYGTRQRTERKRILDLIKVEFEGHQFNAPANYDELLTQIYGEYIRLPPVDQQISHNIKAFWKSNEI